jgi:hypothetical protein
LYIALEGRRQKKRRTIGIFHFQIFWVTGAGYQGGRGNSGGKIFFLRPLFFNGKSQLKRIEQGTDFIRGRGLILAINAFIMAINGNHHTL